MNFQDDLPGQEITHIRIHHGRNFVLEMWEAIQEVLDQEGDMYETSTVAHRVVGKLRANDPGLLQGWLDQQAEHMVHQFLNSRDRSLRATARAARTRSVFAGMARQHESGDTTVLAKWLEVPFTLPGNIRKPLRSMNKRDLLDVSASYRHRETRNRMTAIFLETLAEHVGSGSVGERYTEDEIDAMWQSIGGSIDNPS